jgi:micrococcal nuclease
MRVGNVAAVAVLLLMVAACEPETDARQPALANTRAAISAPEAKASPKPKPSASSARTAAGRPAAKPKPAPSTQPKAAPPARPPATPAATSALPAGDDGVVTRHTDGDTLRVDGVKIRFIGIDTPEVGGRAECYGAAAAARTASLLPVGTRVRLGYDIDRHDRYGRTLAYVYRAADGLFVNGDLVRSGYANVMTVPPNVRHADALLALQREARDAGRGLWSSCGTAVIAPLAAQPEAKPQPEPEQVAKPTPAPAQRAGCDPSYPGVCIPAGPDLDCPQVAFDDFDVVGDDPHRFDADRDGIGCDS